VNRSGIAHRLAVLWDDYLDCCDPRYGIGGGLVLAWLFLLSFSTVFSRTAESALGNWRGWMLIALFVLLLAVSIAAPVIEGRGRAVAVLGASGAGVTLGTLLLALSSALVVPALGAVVALAFATIGLAGLLLGWAHMCAHMVRRGRVGVTATAAIVGSAVYLLLVPLPGAIALALGAILPIAAAGVLQQAMLAQASGGGGEAGEVATSGSTRLTGLLYERAFAITIVGFGLLLSLVSRGLAPIVLVQQLPAGPLFVGAFLVTEIALTVYMIRVAHREDPNVAFRPTGLLVAIGFLALPLAGPGLAPLAMALSFAGIGAFLVYYWIVMGNIAQRFGWAPSRVYAQGLCLLLLGAALGEGAAALLALLAADEPQRVAFIAIVALFALAFTFWMKVEGAVFANEPVDAAELAIAAPPDAEGAEERDRARKRTLAIDTVTARYGISAREGQIIELLLRGRNVPYICDELFIAKSTVETHVKHIYAKLGISSRQQLIDLVERLEAEAQG